MNNNQLIIYLLLTGTGCAQKFVRLFKQVASSYNKGVHFIKRTTRLELANNAFLTDTRLPIAIAVADIAFTKEERLLLKELVSIPHDQLPAVTVKQFDSLYLLRSLKLHYPDCLLIGLIDYWHPNLGQVLHQVAHIDSIIERDAVSRESVATLFGIAAICQRLNNEPQPIED